MMRRALARGGLGLVATAALAVAGCTAQSDNTTNGEGRATQNASQTLTQAVTKLQQDTYKMTMTVTISGQQSQLTGAMDPKKKVGSFTATTQHQGSTAVTEWRIIGSVLYLNRATPGAGTTRSDAKTWRRLNQAETEGTSNWYDGAQMARPLQQATDVRRVGNKSFTGTLDLAVSAKALGMPTPAASAPSARLIPFEADVDDKGRLVRYRLDTPDAKGNTGQVEIRYSDFGTPVNAQAPPTAQILDTPNR